jgi:(p)ppGpp synthase/HD superfamily hydrolase
MNNDRYQSVVTLSGDDRVTRPLRPTLPFAHPGTDAKPVKTASPAALDEVFEKLARGHERMKLSNARFHQAQQRAASDETVDNIDVIQPRHGIGTIPSLENTVDSALDPSPMRELAQQMDRQRERLAQLLRDIEVGSEDA